MRYIYLDAGSAMSRLAKKNVSRETSKMQELPQFQIPQSVRDLAERNITQVRTAYDQFLKLMQKAHDTAVKSQGVMTQSALEIQNKAMQYAQANVEANFRFAAELARSKDLKEYLEVQTAHAKAQMETYAKQTQEVTRLLSDAAHKAQPKT